MTRGGGQKNWTCLALVLVSWFAFLSPLGNKLESEFGLPLLFYLRGPLAAPSELGLVYIDGNTAAQLDLPDEFKDWPRSVHACVLKKLQQAGAHAVVFDVAFLQTSQAPAKLPFPCPELSPSISADSALVEVVRDFGRVAILEQVELAAYRSDSEPFTVRRTVKPFQALAQAAAATAPFVLPASGRVDGFWPFLCQSSGSVSEGLCESRQPTMPVLALGLFQQASGKQAGQGHQVDPSRHLLNFYGPPRTIPCLSYQQLLRPELRDKACGELELAEKLIFIGYADYDRPAQLDSFPTVYSDDNGVDLAGVEILATAFANLLQENSLTAVKPIYAFALLTLSGLGLGLLLTSFPPLKAIVLSLGAGLLYLFIAAQSFNQFQLLLPLITPLFLQLPLGIILAGYFHYRMEKSRGSRLKASVGRFLPGEALKQISEQDSLVASSDLVYGVCLTTDMEAYTSLAEITTPVELAEMMGKYYNAITSPVKSQGGVVLDTTGDSLMSVWSRPQESPEISSKACEAALGILDNLVGFNKIQAIPVNTRVGLHAGWFALGTVGGGEHLAYKATGDIANTAARIESLNKQLGTRVLCSSVVTQYASGFLLRPLGLFRLKGKNNPINVVELMGKKDKAGRDQLRLCQVFSFALELFVKMRWQEALTAFQEVLKEFPSDGPALFYSEIAARYLRSESESQTAVIVMQDK